MKTKILIACDLEGVNYVKGEAYSGLGKDTPEWEIARLQAPREINALAEGLFDLGVECVDLWDNHGGGGNIDPMDLDPRITLLSPDNKLNRMYFGGEYDCICYFGYHAMEGTLGGVLAHTMNSKKNQYYKLNGKYIGEIDMDQYIAAYHGVPSCLFVGGDIACSQAKRTVPEIITVVTKKELSRNEAIFRNNDELLSDIRSKASEVISKNVPTYNLTFPATMEKSFKRMEDAAEYIKKLISCGIDAKYPDDEILGKDAHTVVSVVNNIDEFIKTI